MRSKLSTIFCEKNKYIYKIVTGLTILLLVVSLLGIIFQVRKKTNVFYAGFFAFLLFMNYISKDQNEDTNSLYYTYAVQFVGDLSYIAYIFFLLGRTVMK